MRRRKHILNADDDYIHLTEGGLARMKKRLAELKASLPHLIAETAEAAAQGDRSDNDGYRQSKALLGRTQRRIWSIEDQLNRIILITPGRNSAGTVRLGSKVTLETKKNEQRMFEIVGSRETNPGSDRISHKSPLGKALLGQSEGDVITVVTPAGERNYKILGIQ